MKLIALDRRPGIAVAPFPRAAIIPDSAIILPGRPLFVPDFTASWRAELLPAVRISRLGKGMAERFATRYYDAVTLLMRLCPPPEFEGGLASAFDGTIMLGCWIPVSDIDLGAPFVIRAGEEEWSVAPADLGIDSAIAAIGQLMTLRNGDIVSPAALPLAVNPAPGVIVEATLNGSAALRARLK